MNKFRVTTQRSVAEPGTRDTALRIEFVEPRGMVAGSKRGYRTRADSMGYRLGRTFAALLIAVLGTQFEARAADISSYAFVNDDGTLRIRGKTIHLYGILIPPTDETCQFFVRPPECGSRAALALEFKIGTSFVACDVLGKGRYPSLIATCYVGDVDLAAYLLERGWAAALPEAPPLYGVLEKVARSRGIGMWGFPIGDVIR